MLKIANTPKPPYYAVIFTSKKIDEDKGYSKMSDRMVELVSKQDGFLGFESARENLGITVLYWKDNGLLLIPITLNSFLYLFIGKAQLRSNSHSISSSCNEAYEQISKARREAK